jgi:general secretion pathway protein L
MRIAGIDVSGDEVRLVALERTPLRTRFAGMARAALPPGAEPAEKGRVARDLLLSRGLGGATAVIGMDSGPAMLRRVSFPFASPGKIARVLRLELESLLPGPLAAQAVSCARTGQDGAPGPALSLLGARSGRHAFMAAAVPREAVDRHREGLAVLDPEVLDLDVSGLWRTALAVDAALDAPGPAGGAMASLRGLFAPRGAVAPPEPLLAVDAAPGRALLAFVAGGQVRRARHAPLPGDAPGGEDWFAELARQALLTLAAEAGFGPARVLLLGASATPELASRLAGRLGQTAGLCREVRCPADLGGLLFPGQGAAAALGADMAVACGLALRGTAAGGLNFLDDDPSGTSLAREVLGLSGRPGQARRAALLAAGLALAVLAYGTDAFFDIRFKTAWLKRLDGELAALVAQAAPGTRKGMEPSQYVSVVKDRLREMEAAWPARLRSGVGGGLTQLLRTVSRAIPEDSPVVVGEFTVDGRRVRMTATADAYETVESVRAKLLESGGFSSVEIKGATARAGGSGVEFELEMTAAGGETGA